jgi:YhcN/YlaJ family sporulation lipoprotein
MAVFFAVNRFTIFFYAIINIHIFHTSFPPPFPILTMYHKKRRRVPVKRLLAISLSAAFFITLGAGCAPVKKPVPPRPDPRIVSEPNDPAPRNNQNRMPTTSSEMNKLAEKMSDEAVQVSGVKSAAVAISGTDAYVGIDLKSGAEGKETNNIKKAVADRLENADNRITNVYVSTDADTITRIKRVAKGIAAGKPLASFTAELAEIGRRITPQKDK